MNGFQILNKEGIAIHINKIDEEICELLNKPVDKNSYCMLGNREDYKSDWEYLTRCTNWFDSIGWMIAHDGKSFEQILEHYSEVMKEFIGQKDENGIAITLEDIYPYHCKVLNTFISKGYKAVQVAN